MDRRELVSVVVPNYNGATYLGQTLAALRAQTWSNLEIIVVDDGSTDESPAIARRIAQQDPRVRAIAQPNAGVGAARNAGAAMARGEYIAFVDHDDVCHPEKVELQARALREGGERVGLAYTWYATIDAHDRVIGTLSKPEAEGDVLRELCRKNVLGNGSNAMVRRSVLDTVGGFPTGLDGCEDLAFYLKVAERYHFAVVRRILLGYRQTPESMSSDGVKMIAAMEGVLAPYYLNYPQYIPDMEAAKDGLLDWLMLRALKARRRDRAMTLGKIMYQRQGIRLLRRAPLHAKALSYAAMPGALAKAALSLKQTLDGAPRSFEIAAAEPRH